MSKVFTFVTILVGLMAMLTLFGFQDSATSQLLKAVSFNNPEDLKSWDFYTTLFDTNAGIIAALLATAAITIGVLGRGFSVEPLIVGFVAGLAGWIIGDMYTVIASASNFGTEFAFIGLAVKVIFVVFVAGFLISIVEWWRGVD